MKKQNKLKYMLLHIFLFTTFLVSANVTPGSPDNFVTEWNPLSGTKITFYAETDAALYDLYWEEIGNPSNNGYFLNQTNGVFELNGLASNTNYKIETNNVLYFEATPAPLIANHTLKYIHQWGSAQWTSFNSSFANTAVDLTATDVPNLIDATDISEMFKACYNLIGANANWNWNTITIIEMRSTFANAYLFNADISSWNVSNVKDFSSMFSTTYQFNQDIGIWDTKSAEDMSLMFRLSGFNRDIGPWNVSNVRTFRAMFWQNVVFNQDIGMWDVRKGESFGGMFYQAESFNQYIGDWELNSLISVPNWGNNPMHYGVLQMLTKSGMDCNNYSETLIGWSNNINLPHDMRIGVGELIYGTSAINARNYLISIGWEFGNPYNSNDSDTYNGVTIVGIDSMCIGDGNHYTASINGGEWSVSDTTIASIDSTGYLLALGEGVTTVNYSRSPELCVETFTITVKPTPILSTSILAQDTSLCTGDTLVLSAPNIANTSYTWTGPNGFTSNQQNPTHNNVTISNSGVYDLVMIDTISGCTSLSNSNSNVLVNVNQTPLDIYSNGLLSPYNNIGICETDTASILLNMDNNYNTNNLTYTWTGPNGFTANTQGIYFNPITSYYNGLYNVIVTDTLTGCVNTGSTSVNVNDLPFSNISNVFEAEYTVCENDDLIIEPLANNNTNYNYTWTHNGVVVSNDSLLSFTPLSTNNVGNYNVSVVDTSTTCSNNWSFDIYLQSIDSLNLDSNYVICKDEEIIFDLSNYDSVNVNGAWENNNLSNYIIPGPGTYNIVGLNGGCASNQASVIVSNNTTTYTTYHNINNSLCYGDDFEFGILSPDNYTINWSGVNNYSSSYNENTIYNINTENIGTYNYNVVFDNGCAVNGSIELPIPHKSCFEIPAIITPNNDGLNDYWIIDFLILYPNHELSIYNRWGTKVYSASPYENEFNGYANRGLLKDNNPLPNGTYFYVIELGDDKNEVMKGYLEIQK